MAKRLSFTLHNGLFVIRDAKGELFAKVGTRKQLRAVLGNALNIKDKALKDLNLDEYAAEDSEVFDEELELLDGVFLKDKKWFYRFEGVVSKDSYKSREEAQEAYNTIE